MGITTPSGATVLSPEQELAKRVGRIDDVKAGDSDKAFGEQTKAVYEEIVKATKTKYPDLDAGSPEFKAKFIEVADSSIGKAVSGNDLSAKAAEAVKASLKQAQDADSFARLMIDQRSQIAADTNSPRSEAQDKMTGMMMAFLEKILAMFGIKTEQFGLKDNFAQAANGGKPPSADPTVVAGPAITQENKAERVQNFLADIERFSAGLSPEQGEALNKYGTFMRSVFPTQDGVIFPDLGAVSRNTLQFTRENQIFKDTLTPGQVTEFDKLSGQAMNLIKAGVPPVEILTAFSGGKPSAASVGLQAPETATVAPPVSSGNAAVDVTAANDIDFATVTDGTRPPSSFQANIAPSPTVQMLAQIGPMPYTVSVPPSAEPFVFDIGQSNLLTGHRFNVAANAPTFTVVDPKVDPVVVALRDPEAKAQASSLGFGT